MSSVILKATNPKTRETTALQPFRLPLDHKDLAIQPTAVEARHFAAAYTLFRVANMKNLHMMMPPTYKDLWKGAFQDIKKEEEAQGRGWMFAADPFAIQEEREKEKMIKEKLRAEQEKERERRRKEQGPSIVLSGSSTGATHLSNENRMKGWTKVPKIEMGKRTRQAVESLIRKSGSWNPHGVRIDSAARTTLIEEISKMDFRKSHVEEALSICKDKEEALEWLLIHVPEDDLPRWALPDKYTAGVTMASGDLKREATQKRLAEAGYAMDICEEALEVSKGDENKAAALLQNLLMQKGTDPDNLEASVSALELQDSWEHDADVWNEEEATLEAIYSERFNSNGKDSFTIALDLPNRSSGPISLGFRRPSGPYPNIVPILSIHSTLPAYIRLSVIKQSLNYAQDSLLGEPMVFNLIDWLESNVQSIIDNPGLLSDLSSVATSASETTGTRCKQPLTRMNAESRCNPMPRHHAKLNSAEIAQNLKEREKAAAYQSMLSTRRSLPAWKLQEAIVKSVNENPVTIISGETGSGKSTQTVQFILDDMIRRDLGADVNIVCTQPRRISAMGLADRVSEERCSNVGEEIGYAIRGESKTQPGISKITFVTTGVLLRRLQSGGVRHEDLVNSLADVSHVVVDEVHERSLDTDLLLVLLRNVLQVKKDLKIILMSATLDAQVFDQYFKNVGTVGKVEIKGRTHPVLDYWLDDVRNIIGNGANGFGADEEEDEYASLNTSKVPRPGKGGTPGTWRVDYDLIAQTVRYVDGQLGEKDGGILIFLPGTAEIDRTIQTLRNLTKLHTLPLHASLLPADQRRVFHPAPAGKRKVVCATNVAETSITIPDVVAVIDTGRVKETSFDAQSNMVRLAETWASRAACKQRRGRAGRVREGTCFKLYTKATEDLTMLDKPEPEIRRVPLEQLVLSVKSMGIVDVPSFLAGALTPPDAGAVDGAMKLLERIGALDGNELTSLGWHLSSIPADLRCAKLMVFGAVFGCLEACLTIASVLTARSPFVSLPNLRDESKAVRATFGGRNGDLVADLRAYEQWQDLKDRGVVGREIRAWLAQNCLSAQTLSDISSNRAQYLASLKETGFLPLNYRFSDISTQGSRNKHNTNDVLIRSLIAAAFTPQISRIELPEKKYMASVSGAVEVDPEARTIKYYNQENGRVFVHPGSTIFDAQGFPGGCIFMAYFTKMATSKVFIRELTPFNAYTLLLFGGPIALDTLGRGLIVDEWLRLRGWARIGVLVSRLRMMLDELLAKKIDDPGMDLESSEVVSVVRKLVEMNGLDR